MTNVSEIEPKILDDLGLGRGRRQGLLQSLGTVCYAEERNTESSKEKVGKGCIIKEIAK